jgi:hypothetical protein
MVLRFAFKALGILTASKERLKDVLCRYRRDFTFSDDHGATWSKPAPLDPAPRGNTKRVVASSKN